MLLRRIKHKALMGLASFLLKFSPGVSYLVFAGDGSARSLCRHIAHGGARRVLVVTDKPLVELGIVETAIAGLAEYPDIIGNKYKDILDSLSNNLQMKLFVRENLHKVMTEKGYTDIAYDIRAY